METEKYEVWACDMDAGISDTGHQMYGDVDHTGTCSAWFQAGVKDNVNEARTLARALRHGLVHLPDNTINEYINGYPKDPMQVPATHAPDGRA